MLHSSRPQPAVAVSGVPLPYGQGSSISTLARGISCLRACTRTCCRAPCQRGRAVQALWASQPLGRRVQEGRVAPGRREWAAADQSVSNAAAPSMEGGAQCSRPLLGVSASASKVPSLGYASCVLTSPTNAPCACSSCRDQPRDPPPRPPLHAVLVVPCALLPCSRCQTSGLRLSACI